MFLDCCNCAAQFAELAGRLETPTNCEDVWIVAIICSTVVLVIGIASYALLDWQDKKYNNLKETEKQKFQYEKDKIAEEQKRKEKEWEQQKEDNKEKSEGQIVETVVKEMIKTDYQKAGDFFKQICDTIKDKDGKLNNSTLDSLLKFFREEWRKPGEEAPVEEKGVDENESNKENESQNEQKDS